MMKSHPKLIWYVSRPIGGPPLRPARTTREAPDDRYLASAVFAKRASESETEKISVKRAEPGPGIQDLI